MLARTGENPRPSPVPTLLTGSANQAPGAPAPGPRWNLVGTPERAGDQGSTDTQPWCHRQPQAPEALRAHTFPAKATSSEKPSGGTVCVPAVCFGLRSCELRESGHPQHPQQFHRKVPLASALLVCLIFS